MKLFLTFILLTVFTNAMAADVSKNDANAMIEHMVKEEGLSKLDAQKAIARLQAMNSKEWKEMNKVAASRAPASESNREIGDLHHAQFDQIQNDMKKLVPERKD